MPAVRPKIIRNAKHLYREQRGVVMAEMMIVLPILLILVFAVISFGYVFIVYEDEGMVVNSVASAIANNPANSAYTQGLANVAGAPFINFSGANTICAQSYAQTATISEPYCTENTWVTSAPAGVTAGTPYLVAIEAQVTPKLAIPMTYAWLIGKTFTQKTIVTVAGSPNYPVCPAGHSLTSGDGTALTCTASAAATAPPTATMPSGTFCGNGYQTNCGGYGQATTPGITPISCTINGTSYDPVINCPPAYRQYKYVNVSSTGHSDTCFWTCVKN